MLLLYVTISSSIWRTHIVLSGGRCNCLQANHFSIYPSGRGLSPTLNRQGGPHSSATRAANETNDDGSSRFIFPTLTAMMNRVLDHRCTPFDAQVIFGD